MSLFNSIMPSRLRLGASTHELPLYHSPPPDSPGVFPPPPVAASMYASSPSHTSGRAPVKLEFPTTQSEDMIMLMRRERQIEGVLQDLLDAQSEALMAGASAGYGTGPTSDDVLSIGSGTPRVRSPIRSPEALESKRARVDPSTARRGIYRAVKELAAIKAKEEQLTGVELKQCQTVRKRLDNWDRKRSGLRKEIHDIQHEDTASRTRTLQDEADKLQDEILETEQKLNRMRRKHQAVLDEISQIDNSVQSKLTSYVTSLNMLEDDVQKFLANPPQRKDRRVVEKGNFLALPVNRRTLEMARGYWGEQQADLESIVKGIEREKSALDKGAALWKTVILRLEGFEQHLRQEMGTLGSDNSSEAVKDLLSDMEDVGTLLERDLKTATSRDWRLLIACIGAELEAFKQAQNILERFAGVHKDTDPPPETNNLLEEEPLPIESDGDSSTHPETVWNTPKASRIIQPLDDSDDDPDPELMVAKPDTDTD